MQVVFIRHGEPDYAPCDARGLLGQGRDLAPLTPRGRQQARTAADSPLLCGCEFIVSSPYTRALETAAIISRVTGLGIKVELDLHEWMPDKTFRYSTAEQSHALHADFLDCRGVYPEGETRVWETIPELIARVKPVLDRYCAEGARRIAIVSHGGVIRRFVGKPVIDYCELNEIDYTPEAQCFGFV